MGRPFRCARAARASKVLSASIFPRGLRFAQPTLQLQTTNLIVSKPRNASNRVGTRAALQAAHAYVTPCDPPSGENEQHHEDHQEDEKQHARMSALAADMPVSHRSAAPADLRNLPQSGRIGPDTTVEGAGGEFGDQEPRRDRPGRAW